MLFVILGGLVHYESKCPWQIDCFAFFISFVIILAHNLYAKQLYSICHAQMSWNAYLKVLAKLKRLGVYTVFALSQW